MALVFAGIAAACLSWYALVGLSGRLGQAVFSPVTIKALSLICSAMMIVFSMLLFYKGYNTFL
jgi:arginine exporter protein ArgO